MYKRSTNGLMVVGIAGIVLVMSIFTWVMYGVSQQIVQMTDLMGKMSKDVHAMVEVQQNMANMAVSMANMEGAVNRMSQDVSVMTATSANMNANMARMSEDVARSAHMFSSPMNYMRNMTPW